MQVRYNTIENATEDFFFDCKASKALLNIELQSSPFDSYFIESFICILTCKMYIV